MIYAVKATTVFTSWVHKLKNKQAKALIAKRIVRMQAGNFGDMKMVGNGVRELRIHMGAGYRVYFCERNNHIILLLCGGDKGSQQKDIERAKIMASEV